MFFLGFFAAEMRDVEGDSRIASGTSATRKGKRLRTASGAGIDDSGPPFVFCRASEIGLL